MRTDSGTNLAIRRRVVAAGGYRPGALEILNGEQERLLLEHLPIVRFLARRIYERLRSPRDLRRKGRAVEEAVRALTARMGRSPGEAEIAKEMGVSLENYQSLLGDLKRLEVGMLHVEQYEDSAEEELAYVPGRPEEDPLFCCLRGELKEKLREAIEHLPERERLVMTLSYFEELTMREIGIALGVVESRVSQMPLFTCELRCKSWRRTRRSAEMVKASAVPADRKDARVCHRVRIPEIGYVTSSGWDRQAQVRRCSLILRLLLRSSTNLTSCAFISLVRSSSSTIWVRPSEVRSRTIALQIWH